MNRRRRAVYACGVAVLLLAACGSSGGHETLAVPRVYDLDHDPAAGIVEPAADRSAVLPAGQLRVQLEAMFQWHGITLLAATGAVGRGEPGSQPWIDALASNTDDVTSAVGLVYGPVDARAFYQQWAQHTQFLINYADAVRTGNKGEAEQAKRNLADYARDSGTFIAKATGGALDAQGVATLLTTHVDHVIAEIDAMARGDFSTAANLAVQDNAFLTAIALALSQAFAGQFPQAFPASTDNAHIEICSLANRAGADALLANVVAPGATVNQQNLIDDLASAATGEITDAVGPVQTAYLAQVRQATASGDAATALTAAKEWRNEVATKANATP